MPDLPVAEQTTMELEMIHSEGSSADFHDPDHHLRRKASGYWQMRVTIDRGRKFVGQRAVLGLGTRDKDEAKARRDLILDALHKAQLIASSQG